MPEVLMVSVYDLATLFFSQSQTVPLFTISLTPRVSTMYNRKVLRCILFIDSVTCCFPAEYFLT